MSNNDVKQRKTTRRGCALSILAVTLLGGVVAVVLTLGDEVNVVYLCIAVPLYTVLTVSRIFGRDQ